MHFKRKWDNFFPRQFTMPLTGVLYYLLRHRKVAQEKIMDLDIFAEHGQRTSVLWIVELYSPIAY